MSIAWQADIFCDGPAIGIEPAGNCHSFIAQGEVMHDSTKALAKGAWEFAQANGWERIKWHSGRPMRHLCPTCAQAYREQQGGEA